MAARGLCECGCGEAVRLAPNTDTSKGWVRGQPLRFVAGHQWRKRPAGPNPSGVCQCGCGLLAPVATSSNYKRGQVRGQPVRFIYGHNPRIHSPFKANYNGGIGVRPDGRAMIYCRDGSKVYFYRAVMEAKLGRALRPEEVVHHRNGDPTDDRPENLELFASGAEHTAFHARQVSTCSP